jgi:hypothetical protein
MCLRFMFLLTTRLAAWLRRRHGDLAIGVGSRGRRDRADLVVLPEHARVASFTPKGTAVMTRSSRREDECTVLTLDPPSGAWVKPSTLGASFAWPLLVRVSRKRWPGLMRRAFGTIGMRWVTGSPTPMPAGSRHSTTGAPGTLACSFTACSINRGAPGDCEFADEPSSVWPSPNTHPASGADRLRGRQLASAKTIERHDGVLEDVRDTGNGPMRRYWITIGGPSA